MPKPNIIFVFADQWRAQATGYAGNPDVKTPNLDQLAKESLNFSRAISGCPVCSPYRASLLTGQYPLTNGVFVNDVCLNQNTTSLAQAFTAAGYDTAYIGKWHLDGHGRSNYIPPERRQGFDYWKVLECTHDYNHSAYYAGNSPEKRFWEGYDALAQTRDAQAYLKLHQPENPFLLVLSWGPPHNPYETAPPEFQALYDPRQIYLRPNVPKALAHAAQKDLAGYYAHCSALDYCLGELRQTVTERGLDQNTIFIFTADHGDMHGSQGHWRKQRPWEESVRVPFLMRWPARFGSKARELEAMIDAPDMMPTLLGLCDLPIPETVEGHDFSTYLANGKDPSGGARLLQCVHPFGEWRRGGGGFEYRGLRTRRFTYARSLERPWLLYDNQLDPYQQKNLIDQSEYSALQKELEAQLQEKLRERGDNFLPGMDYIRQWGYEVDENGTVPYTV